MAQEVFEYRGRQVVIETLNEGGRLGWRFRVGEDRPVWLRQSPASTESEALAEARSAARSVLDLRGAAA